MLTNDWTITADIDPWRLAAGFALAAWGVWAYRRTIPPVSKPMRALLASLRVAGFLLLALFALDPSIMTRRETEREPVIALLVDVSASMNIEDIKGYPRMSVAAGAARAIEKSPGGARVDIIPFASGLLAAVPGVDSIPSAAFEGTDIYGALEEAERRYTGENLSAIALVSDGRVTRGMTGRPVPGRIPVFAIAAGDTSTASDLAVDRVEYERTVYTGTKEKVGAVIRYSSARGERAVVELVSEGGVIDRAVTGPLRGSGLERVELQYIPDREGPSPMEIRVLPAESEAVEANNVERFRVNVLKERIEILFFDAAPDWNMTFIRRLCGSSKRLDLDTVMPSPGDSAVEFPPAGRSLSQYDLVIIGAGGDFPSSRDASALTEYVESGGALLFFGSEGSPLLSQRSVTLLRSSLPLSLSGAPRVETGEFRVYIGQALDAPYLPDMQGALLLSPLSGVIAGLVPTAGAKVPLVLRSSGPDRPFIVLEQKGRGMTAVILGFPVWRWRLAGESGAGAWKGLVGGLVQYLAEGRESPLLDVQTDRTSYRTGERIRISVFPANERAGEDVRGEIFSSGETGTPVETFIPAPSVDGPGELEAVIAGLRPGDYKVRVRSGGGAEAEGSVSFSVEELSVEMLRTSGDLELLGGIASSSGGALLEPGDAGGLAGMIDLEADVMVTTSVIKLRGTLWLFVAIIIVFAAEWLTRKLLGLV